MTQREQGQFLSKTGPDESINNGNVAPRAHHEDIFVREGGDKSVVSLILSHDTRYR
jgi:hypothetical protein